jgi:hypothetical protein
LKALPTALQIKKMITPERWQLEQTSPFLLTTRISGIRHSTEGARLPGLENKLVTSGKVVSVFLEPEAELLGNVNQENIAIITVAKPGTETGSNID